MRGENVQMSRSVRAVGSPRGCTVHRVRVSSSNIVSIGYEADTQTLEVEFRDGAVYEYEGVPPGVHSEFMGAASQGAYLHRHIRDRYPYRRVR